MNLHEVRPGLFININQISQIHMITGNAGEWVGAFIRLADNTQPLILNAPETDRIFLALGQK